MAVHFHPGWPNCIYQIVSPPFELMLNISLRILMKITQSFEWNSCKILTIRQKSSAASKFAY